jgi:hypothetical protein
MSQTTNLDNNACHRDRRAGIADAAPALRPASNADNTTGSAWRRDDTAALHGTIGVPQDSVPHVLDRLAADFAHQLGLGGAGGKRDSVAELRQFRRQKADRRLRAAQRPLERRIRIVCPGGGVNEDDVHAPAL